MGHLLYQKGKISVFLGFSWDTTWISGRTNISMLLFATSDTPNYILKNAKIELF